MKVKKIKIKSLEEGLKDFKKIFEKIQHGEEVKPVKGPKVYFESLEAVRSVLTPERIKLLKIIKTYKPQSIYELSKISKKDIKNVSQDLRFLSEIGLVELECTQTARRSKRPVLLADHIIVELAI